MFYEKDLKKKQIKNSVELSGKNGDKLYAKWKSYNNSCNSCIDQKDVSVSVFAVLFGILIRITSSAI